MNDEVDVQVYLELCKQVLANTTEPRQKDDEGFSHSGRVMENDSPRTLRKYLCALGMTEVHGNGRFLFSALEGAIDKDSWPFIPHIRETYLVQSEKFSCQPDILIGCTIRTYALNQRTGTMKLLTMRGIVTIRTLGEAFGNIGIDPNVQHGLNFVANGGHQPRIIWEASFARRRGNGSNTSQFIVFGLRFGSMKEMGYIFCKDPEEPSSGPTGHVTLTYPPSMIDDALRRQESFDESKGSESLKGSATADFIQEPATAKRICCPYCPSGYVSMGGLISHFLRSLKNIPDPDDKHSVEEISDFIRNCRRSRLSK